MAAFRAGFPPLAGLTYCPCTLRFFAVPRLLSTFILEIDPKSRRQAGPWTLIHSFEMASGSSRGKTYLCPKLQSLFVIPIC